MEQLQVSDTNEVNLLIKKILNSEGCGNYFYLIKLLLSNAKVNPKPEPGPVK